MQTVDRNFCHVQHVQAPHSYNVQHVSMISCLSACLQLHEGRNASHQNFFTAAHRSALQTHTSTQSWNCKETGPEHPDNRKPYLCLLRAAFAVRVLLLKCCQTHQTITQQSTPFWAPLQLCYLRLYTGGWLAKQGNMQGVEVKYSTKKILSKNMYKHKSYKHAKHAQFWLKTFNFVSRNGGSELFLFWNNFLFCKIFCAKISSQKLYKQQS